jgi:hypothetical protein
VTLENKPEEEEKALYCEFHARSRWVFFCLSECFCDCYNISFLSNLYLHNFVGSGSYFNRIPLQHFKSSRQKLNNKSNRDLLDIDEVFLSNIASLINPRDYGNRLNIYFFIVATPHIFRLELAFALGGLTAAKILSSHPLLSCFLV